MSNGEPFWKPGFWPDGFWKTGFWGTPADPPEPPQSPPASAIWRLRWQLTPGEWSTVNDVVLEDGVRFVRGIQGNGPEDNMFTPGTLSFTLDNSAVNSLETEGLYSPQSANCLSGFGRGTPVQVVFQYDEEDTYMWTGKLTGIQPTPGAGTPQRTHCQAIGQGSDLFDAKVREITPQLAKTEVELLQSMFAALPATAQPTSVEYDAAESLFDLALDDLKDGTIAAAVAKRILNSCRGCMYERGDGSLRYMSPASRALALSRFEYTSTRLNSDGGLSRPDGIDGKVYNRVRVGVRKLEISGSTTDVLFSHDGRLEIPAGETVELWYPYQDQTNKDTTLGGMDFQTPLSSGSDYSFNSAENGSGTDLTATMTVTPSFFSSNCKVVVTNGGAVPAFKQTLQGRGRKIQDKGEVWVESFAAMPYGERLLELTQPYQNDPVQQRDHAAYIRAHYQDLADQVESISYLANQNEEMLQEFINTDIGDVVSVTESVTGTAQVRGHVQWIECEIGMGDMVNVRYGLAPRIETEILMDETVEVDDVLTVSTAAPETRIGFAQIGLSEIAA